MSYLRWGNCPRVVYRLRPTHLGCLYLGPLPPALRKMPADCKAVLNDGGVVRCGAVRYVTI